MTIVYEKNKANPSIVKIWDLSQRFIVIRRFFCCLSQIIAVCHAKLHKI
jgi:hypothetical protein